MKFKSLIFIFFVCVLTFLSGVACSGDEDVDNTGLPTENQQLVSASMNKNRIDLEKHESFKLIVDSTETFAWSTTNAEVASVDDDGVVVAMSEGVTIVKATSDFSEAKCIVSVSDNKLVPQIKTNINDIQLTLLKDTDFTFEYDVYYNKNILDVEVDVDITGHDEASVLEGNKIFARNYGSCKILLSTEWAGMAVTEVIDVYVVPDVVAKISDFENLVLYNDERAGDTSITFNPTVFENGIALEDEQVEIVAINYDETIIECDMNTLTFNAIKKGETDVTVELKSKLTGNTAQTKVNVVVELYNEDKTDVYLRNAYEADGVYEFYLDEIFSDKTENEYAGLQITYVADVTNGNEFNLEVENGKIDISKASINNLIGERVWYIECEKFARTVAVVVKNKNFEKLICGNYVVEAADYNPNWRNILTLSQIDGKNSFIISDPVNKETLYSGTFRIYQWNNENIGGKIIFDKIGSQVDVPGYYWDYNGVLYMDVSLNNQTKYSINYYCVDMLPYAGVAGEYTSSNWVKQTFVLNEDGSCIFDKDNNLFANQIGSYIIKPETMTTGIIIMSFEKGFNGQTVFNCFYELKNGRYIFTVTVGTNELTYTQKLDKSGPYTEIAGYYSSGDWIYWKLNLDGTVIFDYFGLDNGNIQKVGNYILMPTDATCGKIKFIFNKNYCGYYEHEGEYYINDDGKYVFKVYVYGSGSIIVDDVKNIRTFTQQINLLNND